MLVGVAVVLVDVAVGVLVGVAVGAAAQLREMVLHPTHRTSLREG